MDKKLLMDNLFKEAHERGLFDGTWLFAENDEIVSKGAYGMRDLEGKLPIQEDSIFDIASVSKQFTAAAVMIARRKGLLGLEDEITKFFPEIPYKGITILNLLHHTGGLPDYADDDWIENTARKENTIPDNNIVVRYLCECGEEARFAPGDEFEYSNTGYNLLAAIVEKVSDMKFEDFLLENVFKPAGMNSTRVIHRRKDNETVENLAYGRFFEGGKYILPDDSKEITYVVPLDGMAGDGNVHTNVLDMFKWDQALREGKILTREEQEMMWALSTLNNGEPSGEDDSMADLGIGFKVDGYGFGWEIIHDEKLGLIVQHTGGWQGYLSYYVRFVDANRMFIILMSHYETDMRGGYTFWNAVRMIAMGEDPKPIQMIEDLEIKNPDKSKWQSYVGKYEHKDEDFYIDEVFIKDGDLYATLFDEDETEEIKLYPLKDKEFGRKFGYATFVFGKNCVKYIGNTCKKLS